MTRDTRGKRTRRGVLRTTAAGLTAGVAVTGTGAAITKGGDNSDAPQDFPRVSTRDHFDDDANLINGESEWSYEVDGSWPFWGETELTLFVHGWRSSDEEDEDIDAGYECRLALEAAGYTGSTAVFSWDSDKGDSGDLGWADGKDIAERNGKKLANFCQWYANEYDVGIRLIGHSLGARVIAFALRTLDDAYGESQLLWSVSLLGGAIENDDPSMDAGWNDDEFGPHIEYATQRFDNFHSYDDDVLENIYKPREFDAAVGEVGIEGEAPYNYTDHDVTPTVGENHGKYYKESVGVMDQVVATF